MAAISAEIALPRDEQTQRKVFPPIGFFGRLFAPLIALMLGFISAERKRIFLRRLDLTYERISDAKEFKRLKKALNKESLEFAHIVQVAYAQFGQRSDKRWDGIQPSRKGERKRVSKIQFQAILFDSELVYIKVLTRKRSIFGTRPALPYMVRVSDLITDEAKVQLETFLERQVTFRLEAKTGLWIMIHRLAGAGGIPRFVSYREILPHYKSPERFQLILGIGERKTVHSIYLDEQPHILIGGATQTGKSNLVNVMISTMVRNLTPDQMQLILIDLKQVEFNHYEDLPHMKYPIIFDAKAAHDALAAMKLEMMKRGALFNLSKAKNIQQYNDTHPSNKLPRWVCFIDEFAEIVNGDDTALAEATFKLVKSITSVGRALGVHIFICTQRPDAQVVPMQVRNNVAVRIGGRTGDRYASQVLIESNELTRLPTDIKGRMAYRLGANVFQVQPPFISNDEVAESVGIARGRAVGVIDLKDNEAVINREGLVNWILFHNGGSMAHKPLYTVLRDYAVSDKMLETALVDLRKLKEITLASGTTYHIVASGKSWKIIDPNQSEQPPAPELQSPAGETEHDDPAPLEVADLPMPPEKPFDPIQMFIDDRCEVRGDVFTSVDDLHLTYVEWCQSKGYLSDVKTTFSKRLKAKGHSSVKRGDVRGIVGLGVKTDKTDAMQPISSMEGI